MSHDRIGCSHKYSARLLTITLSESGVEQVNNVTHVPGCTTTQYACQNSRVLEVTRLWGKCRIR
jgi:hypothetical protein